MTKIKKLHNNWNLNLLNILKLSYCSLTQSIFIKFIKKNLIILKILKKNNFINDFKIIENDILIIYLFYKNNKKFWNNLRVMYKSSHFYFLSIHSIHRFYKNEFKKLIFISTGFGIIDHRLALKKNIGGKLYFLLY